MVKLFIKIIGVIFLITFLIYLFYSPRLQFDVLENPNKSEHRDKPNNTYNSSKESNNENPLPKRGIGTWIGKNISYLTNQFGQADRTYPYKNGYVNYIFKKEKQYYIVLTKNNKIKSVYGTGERARIAPLKVKDDASQIFDDISINQEPSIKVNGKTYDFELSDEDIKTQTLIKFGDIYAQVYVDQQSNSIIGMRYLDKEALALFKPYRLQGENANEDNKEKNDKTPYEQNPNQLMTLYEITNEMRKLKGIQPMKVNSDIAHIASINLYEAINNDSGVFTEDALNNQLDSQNIKFKTASQNVGYDFDDVPTLIHSWMNSDIHRSRMLNKKYDEMGGEAMKDYYSLIFVEE